MESLLGAAFARPLTPAFRRKIIAANILFWTYLLAAQFSAIFFTFPAMIQPAAAIGLAILFLEGLALWPAIALAVLAAAIINGASPFSLALYPFAHALQAISGAYLLRRVNFDPMLTRLRDTFLFVAVALLISTVVPTLGIGIRFLTQYFLPEFSLAAVTWGAWWVGMFFSILIIAPLIMRWVIRPRFKRTAAELTEAIASIGIVALLTFLSAWTPYDQIGSISMGYPLLAALVWVALRVGPRFMTLATALFSTISISGVYFMPPDIPTTLTLGERLFQSEMALSFFAVLFLLLTSLMEERKNATRALKDRVGELQVALSKLGQQDKTKTEFLAILAHELRNPLAPIVSSLEFLRLRNLIEPEGVAHVQIMEDRLAVMRRLLDDLLDMSRISQNKLSLQKGVIDLRTIITQAVDSVSHNFRKRAQSVTLRISPTPILLEADAVRLEQIFMNLLSNASKFTNDGGSVEIVASSTSDEVEVSIRDNGVGIPTAALQKIFEPFHQGEIGARRGHEGLGIGLSLTRQLVGLHGGDINAYSEGTGKGSEFRIKLPLPMTIVAPTQELQGKLSELPDRANGKRILVVDDNSSAAHGIGNLLEHRGYIVAYAYSGEETESMCSAFDPHIILLDIGLPDVDGYEVARKVRNEKGFSGPIIALSGYGQDEDKRKAYEAGFNYHLTKPVGLRELSVALSMELT